MTHIIDINTWDDYWKIFEDLCISLKNQGNTKMIEELFFARLPANGLTDGWNDFLREFKNVYDRILNTLTKPISIDLKALLIL